MAPTSSSRTQRPPAACPKLGATVLGRPWAKQMLEQHQAPGQKAQIGSSHELHLCALPLQHHEANVLSTMQCGLHSSWPILRVSLSHPVPSSRTPASPIPSQWQLKSGSCQPPASCLRLFWSGAEHNQVSHSEAARHR